MSDRISYVLRVKDFGNDERPVRAPYDVLVVSAPVLPRVGEEITFEYEDDRFPAGTYWVEAVVHPMEPARDQLQQLLQTGPLVVASNRIVRVGEMER